MIDKNKLFSLFDNSNNEDKGEQVKKIVLDFNDPYTKLGMFVKLIQNHYTFHQKLEKFLKAENPNYDVEDAKKASEFTVFNRAYYYVKSITPKHKKVIRSFDKNKLNGALNATLEYFESIEEYEKCAHLLKIQKTI